MATKKLIEVALPLEAINEACIREKSIRHGHPASLHLWWARRPLAATRAVIWASLVDDPSSHPEQFPTEDDQNKERERLFRILENLVVWENSADERILQMAKQEIMKSNGGIMPELLDPFAGGGAIPIEAQRLGLKPHAHDLNPVAVMINKAMIEIPPRFSNKAPVNPDDRVSATIDSWRNAQGLAADVSYYGTLLKEKAFQRVGYLYPKVDVPKEQGGGKATVIAWIWTRTIKCPNPACGCQMPLASSFVLSKKKGHEAHIIPEIDNNNKKIKYTVHIGKGIVPETGKTSRGANFKCILCGEAVQDDYVKHEAAAERMGAQLMAIVAEGERGRVYVEPNEEQVLCAQCPKPENIPDSKLPYDPRNIWCVNYGLDTYDKLFTNRQLTTLASMSDLVSEMAPIIEKDAIAAGLENDHIDLNKGGQGAKAYSQAVGVYLAFVIDQLTNQSSSINGWNSINQQMICVFSRQSIAMKWDFAECNIFSNSTGSFSSLHSRMIKAIEQLGFGISGEASQGDAQSDCGLRNIIVSTDPPYYDNIGYADLSDYFYVWMRRSLKDYYPEVFRTILVPKNEELIVTPYRHNGDMQEAKAFFEEGMLEACKKLYLYSSDEIPVTIYYAYKQSDVEGKTGKVAVSSGWETMLTSIIKAGFVITGTWPLRTETVAKLKANINALASSIVLVCRKRKEDAPSITRRNFISILRNELYPALKELQNSNIAPVDLAQSAIGPGMGVFSRYRKVLEADGTAMRVRSALQVINEEIDLYFNDQVGDLDSMSRFCVDLYTQSAFNDIKFGDADILARAKGTSVAALSSHDVVYAKAGTVHLIERTELPEKIDTNESCIWMLTQQLTQAMATGGVEACAKAVFMMFG